MLQNLIILTILLIAFTSGCTNQERREVNISEIEERGSFSYVIGETKPFTGKIVTYYEDGSISLKADYKNGQLHGNQVWYYQGEIYSTVIFKNGKLDGKQSNGEIYKDGELIK